MTLPTTPQGVLRVPVLDHGFVILRNIAGPTRRASALFDADDVDPATAARMSFDNFDLTRPAEADHKLCKFLMKNKHSTPFEMIEIWIEMKIPIFVARQFVRHRTVTINEVSGRYVTLPAEWYIPDPRIVGIKPDRIKQGRVVDYDLPPTEQALTFCKILDDVCKGDYLNYETAIASGIPPELARLFLHLNHYTHWLWKQDLHNMMHFLSLRAHSHAQWEAQRYGYAVLELIRAALPNSMALFDEFRRMPD